MAMMILVGYRTCMWRRTGTRFHVAAAAAAAGEAAETNQLASLRSDTSSREPASTAVETLKDELAAAHRVQQLRLDLLRTAVGAVPAAARVAELRRTTLLQSSVPALVTSSEQAQQAAKERDPSSSVPRWFDDVAQRQREIAEFRQSPEYKELHRSHMTNADMGLFGGEPGFEKSPREWVDPDNPHLKTFWTDIAFSANRRHARYGFYKRDFQVLDVDKLVRHARMLPPPDKLLTDLILQRVHLTDHNAAAIINHGYWRISGVRADQAAAMYRMLEETFERMLMQAVPPIDVGVKTHTAMIRACAAAGRWKEGYEWFRVRALDEAATYEEKFAANGSGANPYVHEDSRDAFVITADFCDAVVYLCIVTQHYAEALVEFQKAVVSGLRLSTSTLDMALRACAELSLDEEAEDVWALYAHYEREPSFEAYEALAACAARRAAAGHVGGVASRLPVVLRDAQRALSGAAPRRNVPGKQTDHTVVAVTQATFAWVMHGYALAPLSVSERRGELVLHMLQELSGRGEVPGSAVLIAALQYCSLHAEDGAETARSLWRDYFVTMDLSPTFEMQILFARAFAFSAHPVSADDYALVTAMIARANERAGSRDARFVRFSTAEPAPIPKNAAGAFIEPSRPRDVPSREEANSPVHSADSQVRRERVADFALTAALLTMCSRMGAPSEAFGIVSRTVLKLPSKGDSPFAYPPSFLFNYVLAANANAIAPNGSHVITRDVIELLFSLPRPVVSRDLVAGLCACRRKWGAVAEQSKLFELLTDYGVPEHEVSLLEMMDAFDLTARATPSVDRTLLGLVVDDASEADVLESAKPALDALTDDSSDVVFKAAMQPFLLSPASLRPSHTTLFIDARQMPVRKMGQMGSRRPTQAYDGPYQHINPVRPFNGPDSGVMAVD
jgi:pentatricopeptide repeat protein